METRAERTRRRFLKDAVGVGTALSLWVTKANAKESKEEKEEDVSPTEDLMREHGVLRRILLVYGEVIRRIDGNQELKLEPLQKSIEIIRAFIEDYHERDEEEYVFPRFMKANKMTDLVGVLLQQHQAGRKLTARAQKLATTAMLKSAADKRELKDSLQQFIRMYQPHAAREDTVLFPAFASLLSEKELHKLMDLFEDKEKALPLGDFEKMVVDVGNIEKAYGLYDLAEFTPKL